MARPEIREEIHKIAEKRRRFGYRRVGILQERKGMIMNEIGALKANGPGDSLQGERLYRIYREEGLSVRRRVSVRGAGVISSPSAV